MRRENLKWCLLLAAILAGAAWLRVSGIGWGLPTKTGTFGTYHPDEPFLLQSLENIYATRSLNPKKIALHYGTFHFYVSGFAILLMKLAGLIRIGPRDFLIQNLDQVDRMYLTARWLSALCTVLAVWGTYRLAKKLYGEEEGVWGAFFSAFAPAAIAIGHYAKLDSFLPALTLALFWRTARLLEEPSAANAWIAGIVCGIVASTRYNCGILIAVPLIVLWRARKHALAGPVLLGALGTFLLTTPYAVLDFPVFFAGLRHMWSFVAVGQPATDAPSRWLGLFDILFNLIPFAVSWPFLLLTALGIAARAGSWEGKDSMLAVSLAAFGLVMWASVTRYSYYIAPILPALCIFAGAGAARLRARFGRPAAVLLAAAALYQLAYGAAFARIYRGPDPREKAGAWLVQNVPPGERVGIVRSYFWTPGVLRRKDSPFTVTAGGDDQSEFMQAVQGAARMEPAPPYFVFSDLEEWNLERFGARQPDALRSFRQFLSQFSPAEIFTLEPRFLGMRFWLRTPPWDLKAAAPSVYVLEMGRDTH